MWGSSGSSPLTRGKCHPRIRLGVPAGLIPAHAGKIRDGVLKSMSIGAHPRSRGENPFSTSIAGRGMGSSPLTRGKSSTTENSSSATGLIPAHAGKIGRKAAAGLSCRAHPRSRGENDGFVGRHGGGSGSSPLTRGKFSEQQPTIDRKGLIPAHAGKMKRAG